MHCFSTYKIKAFSCKQVNTTKRFYFLFFQNTFFSLFHGIRAAATLRRSTTIATITSISLNMDSFISLYYLKISNSPGTLLVSHVLLGENYHTWSRSMQMALKAKNKIGILNGSIIRLNLTDFSYEKWKRCNKMVFSWIVNFVAKEIGGSIIDGGQQ